MSFYEELLTLGQWLQPDEKLALYRYLIQSQRDRYVGESSTLLSDGVLKTFIGNAELTYLFSEGKVSFSVKRKNTGENFEVLRTMKLGPIGYLSARRLQKFFAQSEVDAISNFPLPGKNPQEQNGFGFYSYPFYDLNYYSNGRGKVLGFIKKLRAKDDELLEKLLAS